MAFLSAIYSAIMSVLNGRTPAVVQDVNEALPKYLVTPEIGGTPTEERTFTALSGQTCDMVRMTPNPGTDVDAATRLSGGKTDIIRAVAGDDFNQKIGRYGVDSPLTDIYAVGVSALSNPQGGVVARAAYTFSGITFSSSSGLLGTCSGSVLPATGTPVRFSGGTLPTGLVAGTTYFLIRTADTTAKFATTYANALAGTAIAYTNAGSGTIVADEQILETALAAQVKFTFDDADLVHAINVLSPSRSSSNVIDLALTGVSYAE